MAAMLPLCGVGASPAVAALYSQIAQVSGSGLGDNGTGDGTTRTAQATTADEFFAGSARARSAAGFVSGYVLAFADSQAFPSGGFVYARASAYLQIDDVIISRTDSSLPDTVETTFQVGFDGNTDLDRLTLINGGLLSANDFDLDGAQDGLLDVTKTVPVDTPLSIFLTAGIEARLPQGMPGQIEASFTASLGGSPVFLLPDGYVANSVSGQIEDNWYVGPVSSVVPEPTTLTVLLAALLPAVLYRQGFRRDDPSESRCS